MKCPFCGHLEDKVVDSRSKREGSAIRRRRECLKCGGRYTTYEYVEVTPLVVLKIDGRNEPFDRNKLKRGIAIAFTKRPVAPEVIDSMVTSVEEKCYELGKQQVTSKEIGEFVMEQLKRIDQVAYIRFASVYRRFEDAGEFRKELEKM